MTVTPVMESNMIHQGEKGRFLRDPIKWSVWHVRWIKDGSEIYEAHRSGDLKCFKTEEEALEWARG